MERKFIKICSDEKQSATSSFSVMSYNILADIYATSGYHNYCPSYALNWNHRFHKIFEQVKKYLPDIVCLQEVEFHHLTAQIRPAMESLGYGHTFSAKEMTLLVSPPVNSAVPPRKQSSTSVREGCAVFYKESMFLAEDAFCVNFNAITNLIIDLSPPAKKRYSKGNIAVLVFLRLRRNPQQRLCVVNTHLHANPANRDVKLLQAFYLLSFLQVFLQNQRSDAFVVCGDFNSTPGSAVYDLIAKKRVNGSHPDFSIDPFGVLKSLSSSLCHQLPLASAYSSMFCAPKTPEVCRQLLLMDENFKEPVFTTYARSFNGTLDYIWYSNTSLQVSQLLELVSSKDVEGTFIPSATMPSDHIPLLAEFTFTRTLPGFSSRIIPYAMCIPRCLVTSPFPGYTIKARKGSENIYLKSL